MSYSRVARELAVFLDAYHDASPFLEGPLCPETLMASWALVDELATLARSVRLVWVEGSEHPGGAGTALASVDRIAQSLAKHWETGRTIRLDQADKERLGKALEWLKAADSPEAPQASLSGAGKEPPNPPAPPGEEPLEAVPLKDTRELIPHSPLADSLITFLDKAPNRVASLRDVAKRIYKAQDKPTLAKTRTLIRRTRETLDLRTAPLRIQWDSKIGKATLLITSCET